MTHDLDSLASLVSRPDDEARARVKALLPGTFGRLEELAGWLASVQDRCPPRPITSPRVVVFAGDHGIARAGVSARSPEETVRAVRAVAGGDGAAGLFAQLCGIGVRVVDVAVDVPAGDLPEPVSRWRVRRSSGWIDREDAITEDECDRAFQTGMDVADAEIDAGADLLVLGSIGVGNSTPAAVLIGALTGMDAAAVIGRGSGIDDARWIVKCAAIRDSLRRARPRLARPLSLLAAVGGADFAAMAGFLLRCSIRRTPVLLDGVATAASALVVQRIAYQAPDWWLAGHVTPEPGHVKALDRMALTPLLDYRMRHGQATGALLALPLLRAASALGASLAGDDASGDDAFDRSPGGSDGGSGAPRTGAGNGEGRDAGPGSAGGLVKPPGGDGPGTPA